MGLRRPCWPAAFFCGGLAYARMRIVVRGGGGWTRVAGRCRRQLELGRRRYIPEESSRWGRDIRGVISGPLLLGVLGCFVLLYSVE